MAWIHSLVHRVGLRICAMGWHREPYVKELRPPGMTPEQYAFHENYRCTRCGLVGRIDGHGNLDPEILVRPGSAAEELEV